MWSALVAIVLAFRHLNVVPRAFVRRQSTHERDQMALHHEQHLQRHGPDDDQRHVHGITKRAGCVHGYDPRLRILLIIALIPLAVAVQRRPPPSFHETFSWEKRVQKCGEKSYAKKLACCRPYI